MMTLFQPVFVLVPLALALLWLRERGERKRKESSLCHWKNEAAYLSKEVDNLERLKPELIRRAEKYAGDWQSMSRNFDVANAELEKIRKDRDRLVAELTNNRAELRDANAEVNRLLDIITSGIEAAGGVSESMRKAVAANGSEVPF